MEDKTVLISIHPEYVTKILSGEKRLEFRRRWTTKPVNQIVIYATSPVQKIVAIAEVTQVHVGSRAKFWTLAKKIGGGVTRRNLYSYLYGSKKPVAIELADIKEIKGGINPKNILGSKFCPPQSFRYLTKHEYFKIAELTV